MNYEPWQIKLLATVDLNIDMLGRCQAKHSAALVEQLKAGRAAAVESFEGRLDWACVPWSIKELGIVMPAWGTYGT